MCRAAAAADQRMLPSSSYHQTSYELLLSSILCANTSGPNPNLFDSTLKVTLQAHGIYFVLDMLEILSYLCT